MTLSFTSVSTNLGVWFLLQVDWLVGPPKDRLQTRIHCILSACTLRYCCNVGAYHVTAAMDPSVRVADDEDIKRWVADEDAVVAGAVGKALGKEGLEALVEYFTSKGEVLSAAKLQWAIANSGTLVDEERMKAALALIDGLATQEAQQLVSV